MNFGKCRANLEYDVEKKVTSWITISRSSAGTEFTVRCMEDAVVKALDILGLLDLAMSKTVQRIIIDCLTPFLAMVGQTAHVHVKQQRGQCIVAYGSRKSTRKKRRSQQWYVPKYGCNG